MADNPSDLERKRRELSNTIKRLDSAIAQANANFAGVGSEIKNSKKTISSASNEMKKAVLEMAKTSSAASQNIAKQTLADASKRDKLVTSELNKISKSLNQGSKDMSNQLGSVTKVTKDASKNVDRLSNTVSESSNKMANRVAELSDLTDKNTAMMKESGKIMEMVNHTTINIHKHTSTLLGSAVWGLANVAKFSAWDLPVGIAKSPFKAAGGVLRMSGLPQYHMQMYDQMKQTRSQQKSDFTKLLSMGISGGLMGEFGTRMGFSAFGKPFGGKKEDAARGRRSMFGRQRAVDAVYSGSGAALSTLKDALTGKGKNAALKMAPSKELEKQFQMMGSDSQVFQDIRNELREQAEATNIQMVGTRAGGLIPKTRRGRLLKRYTESGRVTGQMKSLATMMGDQIEKGLSGSMRGVMGVFAPRRIIGYLMPWYGARYRSDLPDIQKEGIFGAMIKTLGLIYVSTRYSSKENNEMLYQVGEMIRVGLGVDGKMKMPAGRGFGERIAASIRDNVRGKFEQTIMQQKALGEKFAQRTEQIQKVLMLDKQVNEVTMSEEGTPIQNKQTKLLNAIYQSLVMGFNLDEGGLPSFKKASKIPFIHRFTGFGKFHKGEFTASPSSLKDAVSEGVSEAQEKPSKPKGIFGRMFGGLFEKVGGFFSGLSFITKIKDFFLKTMPEKIADTFATVMETRTAKWISEKVVTPVKNFIVGGLSIGKDGVLGVLDKSIRSIGEHIIDVKDILESTNTVMEKIRLIFFDPSTGLFGKTARGVGQLPKLLNDYLFEPTQGGFQKIFQDMIPNWLKLGMVDFTKWFFQSSLEVAAKTISAIGNAAFKMPQAYSSERDMGEGRIKSFASAASEAFSEARDEVDMWAASYAFQPGALDRAKESAKAMSKYKMVGAAAQDYLSKDLGLGITKGMDYYRKGQFLIPGLSMSVPEAIWDFSKDLWDDKIRGQKVERAEGQFMQMAFGPFIDLYEQAKGDKSTFLQLLEERMGRAGSKSKIATLGRWGGSELRKSMQTAPGKIGKDVSAAGRGFVNIAKELERAGAAEFKDTPPGSVTSGKSIILSEAAEAHIPLKDGRLPVDLNINAIDDINSKMDIVIQLLGGADVKATGKIKAAGRLVALPITIAETIVKTAGSIFGASGKAMGSLISSGGKLGVKVGSGVVDTWVAGLNAIRYLVRVTEKGFATLGSIFKRGITALGSLFGSLWSGAKAVVKWPFKKVGNFVRGIKEKFSKPTKTLISKIKETAQGELIGIGPGGQEIRTRFGPKATYKLLRQFMNEQWEIGSKTFKMYKLANINKHPDIAGIRLRPRMRSFAEVAPGGGVFTKAMDFAKGLFSKGAKGVASLAGKFIKPALPFIAGGLIAAGIGVFIGSLINRYLVKPLLDPIYKIMQFFGIGTGMTDTQEEAYEYATKQKKLSKDKTEAERAADREMYRKKGFGRDMGGEKMSSKALTSLGPTTRGAGGIALPAQSAVVTSPYGPRNTGLRGASGFHKGIDMRAAYGEPIKAFKAGTIISTGGEWGTVAVRHDDGSMSRYMHLSSISVSPGQKVESGQIVGLAGNTGDIPGMAPHLHFDVKKDGKFKDPEQILASAGIRLRRKGSATEMGGSSMAIPGGRPTLARMYANDELSRRNALAGHLTGAIDRSSAQQIEGMNIVMNNVTSMVSRNSSSTNAVQGGNSNNGSSQLDIDFKLDQIFSANFI